jgi:predicted DNA-binding protein
MSNEKKPKQVRPAPVGLRLKPETLQAIDAAARAAGNTRHAYLREAVEQRLERERGGR